MDHSKPTPTVWIEASDYDLRARQALVLLSKGQDVHTSDMEVMRRIAELADEPSAKTLGVRVRFVRREKTDVEYSVEEMLAATERGVEVRPSPPPPPSTPRRLLISTDGKCPQCDEPMSDEVTYIRHDIEKHDGLASIRQLHNELYCPRLERCDCKIALYERVSGLMARERLTDAGLLWNPLNPFGTSEKK